ncbi:hypothetical protein [Candidatus Roseilinea sp. NK_OTU-006]|jgi:hypothetical protein|uniref:hypothetical protein n=1 Tax=Candidatus Roseilinea sp. NK_OTU-006 TaxID=2704250 RepID=UPI00145E867C|nr:hypothetical protein [Candidatus Roseilinea sp. NK_OTU-006]
MYVWVNGFVLEEIVNTWCKDFIRLPPTPTAESHAHPRGVSAFSTPIQKAQRTSAG